VRFAEAQDSEEFTAQSRAPQQTEPARPLLDIIKLSVPARYRDTAGATRSGSPISVLAAGFLLLLVALTIVFYFAGQESGTGSVWAFQVCQKANSMCQHPEFTAGASVLMALVYFTTKGMEL
jgi:hypothetical protein